MLTIHLPATLDFLVHLKRQLGRRIPAGFEGMQLNDYKWLIRSKSRGYRERRKSLFKGLCLRSGQMFHGGMKELLARESLGLHWTASTVRISRSFDANVDAVNGFCSSTASVSRIP